MRRLIQYLLIIIVPFLFCYKAGGQDFYVQDISSHPRLFLSSEDFSILQRQGLYQKNHPARIAHELILSTASDILKDETSLEFKFDESGLRLLEQSRSALKRIIFCSYAYKVTGNTDYLQHALDDIRVVCAFPNWNAERHFLDAAEMALAVSVGYDWLYSDIDRTLRDSIIKAIQKNLYEPSCNEVFAWFYDADSNWNQVCNAGMVVSALSTFENTDTTSVRVVSEAVRTNRRAIKTIYGQDGIYPEGPGYWSYGTTFQCLMLSALESVYNDDFGLSDQEGFRRTGEYRLSTMRPSGLQFNYSDNVDILRPSYPMWYFASKSSDKSLVRYESDLLKRNSYSDSDEFRVLPLLMGYLMEYDSMGERDPKEVDCFYGHGTTPIAAVRFDDNGSYMAVKGGRAVNPHSHLDGGGFVYEYNSIPWAIDLNRQAYEQLESKIKALGGDIWDMSQSSLRWKILRLNNKGHNTLTINGHDHNVKGNAALISPMTSTPSNWATFDLTNLFEGQVAKVIRTITLLPDGTLRVNDIVSALSDTDASVRWNMVTPATVSVSSDGVMLESKGQRVSLTTESSYPVKYMLFSSDPSDYPSEVSEIEQKNPGITFCGFEAVVPKGKTAEFSTVLKPVK